MKYGSDDKSHLWVREGRNGRIHPKVRLKPEDRIKEMDTIGTDLQVVSVHTQIFGYHLTVSDGLAQAQEINNEIASMTNNWPDRFAGMATLPMQDIKASIKELDRAVNVLGLKGAELDTVVNGKNWDEPEFLPLFKAAESLGAVLFYHPNPQHNLMAERTSKLNMPNSLGVPMEDALITATLICSGVLEKCPDLKVCIAHGGGPACYLIHAVWVVGLLKSNPLDRNRLNLRFVHLHRHIVAIFVTVYFDIDVIRHLRFPLYSGCYSIPKVAKGRLLNAHDAITGVDM